LKKLRLRASLLILCLGLMQTVFAAPPPGATTAPYTLSYSAKLATSTGTPVTTPQSIRFSLWSDSDSDPTDYLPAGTINPAAVGYTGWQETHAVTPDSNGLFHVRLGTLNTLPNFTASTHAFLEVDVKPLADPDTNFEVLDPDGNTSNLTDRHPLDSSAFTINADTVDNHDAGSAPGQIPILDGLGYIPITAVPGGTNADSFILDFDNTAVVPTTIKLQFGSALAKVLEYDIAAGWFNFNDNVNVTGNLTVIGTINGVTVNATTVGPYNQSLVYEPEYSDTVIQGDGTNNMGKLEVFFVDTDGIPGNNNVNYYKWTTRQATLQDMDLIMRVTLPSGFTGFQGTPIEFTYRTEDGIAGNNVINMSVEDATGTPITLTGGTGLVSAAYTTANITFGGSPVFTAGQSVTIKIKLAALAAGGAYAGKLKLNYIGR
jgi:hypothetical protein